MDHRFYLPAPLGVETVELSGPEAHHLIHVLRMRAGQQVQLFDGQGAEATAEIVQLKKHSAELQVLRVCSTPPETQFPVVLGTAVPKGDRFRWLVEKATELGVERLIPLRTEHSVVDPGRGKLEKMQQTVIAACKQSGRSRLMQIDPVTAWDDLIAAEFPGRNTFVAHADGTPINEVFSPAASTNEPVLLCVGPEGGFTGDEVRRAVDAGAQLVNLGLRTLRIETAAVAFASFFVFR